MLASGETDHRRLARRGVELVLEHQAPSGAYRACPTFENYRYCWLRDGSFIADAASRVGVGLHAATRACLYGGLAAWEHDAAAAARDELAAAAGVRLDASLLLLETPFATGRAVPLARGRTPCT